MGNEAYEQLINWLVKTFRSLPETDSPELRELIYFSYTPEEARLAVQMGPEGGKLDELVIKTGMEKEALKALLASMKEKGTLYTEPGSEDPLYRPLGMELPGLIETQAYLDPTTPYMKKVFELWGKFKPIYVGKGIAALGKHVAAWCLVDALPADAAPEENLYEQLKKEAFISLTNCPCRQIERHGHGAEACDCIMECCLPLGDFGRFDVEQGYARQITAEEAITVLDACAQKGQVLMATPGLVICNCCKHGCINFYAQKIGMPHVFAKNHFQAVLDAQTCVSCDLCAERCPVHAIDLNNLDAAVDRGKCIGCGVCVVGCAVNAIKMVRRPDEEIAATDREMMEAATEMLKLTQLDPLVLNRAS